ncbi:hypothetical protein [Hyalangium minutum]|uniref:Tetratricopeptide repeat protein n=1 Tax=Hyalangium minutum TaxID=394096 RepID=A0A085WG55_9BACT|nr:hypothetical protein [Hyalangium minutum]KFE66668.1 hypothetical protein DB31_8882 [Hyalangium minutum]
MPLAPSVLLIVLATAAAAPQADAPLSTPPLPSSSDTCATAEADYTRGFDALVAGDDHSALEAFEHVLAACPTHPYAGELARLTRTRLGPGAKLAEAALLIAPEKPSGFARGSLVVWQTGHGATQGALLCGIIDCDGRGYLAASLLGAGVGAAVSLYATHENGVTSGQSAAINSGTTWGVWYGLAATQVFDIDDESALATVMGSTLSLTGAGIAVALLTHPTAGQVSLANSGGLWSGVITALILAAAGDGERSAFFAIESVVTGVGITSFAVLSQSLPVSRGRMLLIDSGGILGGLLGAATVALLGANDGEPIAIGAAVGAVGGLALTAYITRDFDGPSTPAPEVAVAPTVMGRGGVGLALGGRF